MNPFVGLAVVGILAVLGNMIVLRAADKRPLPVNERRTIQLLWWVSAAILTMITILMLVLIALSPV